MIRNKPTVKSIFFFLGKNLIKIISVRRYSNRNSRYFYKLHKHRNKPEGVKSLGFDVAVNSAIGKRLRSRREAEGLTRERLAEYADISVQFLADIETGRKGMTVQTLRKLALALHCSCDDLIFGEDLKATNNIFPVLAMQLSNLTQDQASLASDILALVKKAIPHSDPPSGK